MVNTPVLTVLLVALSCMAMNSYAQTAAAPPNMTTAVTNMTTAAPSNMTTAVTNMTTAAPSNMTTAAPSNMTTAAPSNMTTAMPSNMTTAVPSNMTTAAPSNATSGPNVTAAVTNMTTAAPLMPNITVSPLDTPLSREGCGSEQLCIAEPSNCNPSAVGCFFLGVQQQSGQNFGFNLAGQSGGYISITLSLDDTVGNNDTTYVCANNNGNVQFFSTVLNNGTLTETELPVNSVRGRVNGTTIQCSFSATLPSQRVRNAEYTVQISNGTFNGTSATLGGPTAQFRSTGVNLANPNANVTNEISNTNATTAATTAAATTTGHAVTFRQSLTQALLIFAGVLGLTIL